MTRSAHCPSAGGARFPGRTDPLSRGSDYTSSASHARRGQLLTAGGELHRPTSSRCTDGDATTAPIPRVLLSPFRLAASRPIRACRTPGGKRSAAAAATYPALRTQVVHVISRSCPWSGTARAATLRAGTGSRVRPEPDHAEACVARRDLSPTGTSRGSCRICAQERVADDARSSGMRNSSIG